MGIKMKFGVSKPTYFQFIFVSVILLIFISIGVGGILVPAMTQDTVMAKVTDKERITTSNGEGETQSFYTVSTKREDGEVEVFSNEDVLLFWKFDSSTVQAELEIGNTYKIKVYGFRIPFLSTYRNIIDVTPVEPEQETTSE